MATMIALSWYDDLKAESDLLRMGVLYTKTSIPFSKIDLKESQVNGARINDAIRHHKVEDYMQGFQNGDTFPRIVVYKSPTGYVILSGNQRSEAIRRLIAEGELPKNVEVECYLVETSDKLLLEIIARSANAAHGEGDTKDERIQQALYCVRRLGMATQDAAKSFLVSETSINLHIRAEEVRSQLQRSGVETHRVAVSSLVPLAKLNFDSSAQTKLGSLVSQHLPPAERVRQVVATVSKQRTPQGRFNLIKDFEKELSAAVHSSNGHNGNGNGKHRATISRVPQRPRRDKFLSILGRLVNFLESENAGEPFSTLEQLQVTTSADKSKAAELLKKARYRLGVLAK